MLRFASEDKTPGDDFLLGRSLSQNRRKNDRGASPTQYTLVPALQMEVSLSTSSSDSASLYHVSPFCLWTCICMMSARVEVGTVSNRGIGTSSFLFTLQVFERSSLMSRSKKKNKGKSKGFYLSAHMYSIPNMSRCFSRSVF